MADSYTDVCGHGVLDPYCGPGCPGFGRALFDKGYVFRDEKWGPAGDPYIIEKLNKRS
jgi:hypothetical protein